MKWYMVGGAVRDLLLGDTPREADMAFEGTAEDLLEDCPHACQVGRSVEVCLVHGIECMPLRGGSLAADLQARDLTINALALEENGILHAHPLALQDLAQGVLRPASSTAFADDPTRIYRLARFASRFPHFQVHAEALAQASATIRSGAHTSLPAERVGNEMRKALTCARPSRFLRTLHSAGAFKHWFAELEAADTIPAGPAPWHDGSVLQHTGEVMDAVAGDSVAVWMALCHDLGKLSTPPDMLPHHYGHEKRGEALAQSLGQRLALPSRHIRAGVLAAREHMKGGIFPTLRAGTRRDLLHIVHSAHLDQPFWKLVDADSGKDMSTLALRQLQTILAVQLPAQWRNRGAASGKQLRLMQCEALSGNVC